MERVWESYDWGAGYDELFEATGRPRPHARALIEALSRMDTADIEERKRRAELAMLNLGITFTVYSESSGVERISRSTWRRGLSTGTNGRASSRV